MKKNLLICALIVICAGVNAQLGKIKIDRQKLGKAAQSALTAVTITDEDVAVLAKEYIDWSDANNPVCDVKSTDDDMKKYAERLDKLVKNIKEDGLYLDFKVYYIVEQNAFACANGSVRVFAGLMDMLTDNELLGVIGHEIGHIRNGDTKSSMKHAYMTMAAKNAIASTGSGIAKLTENQFGQLGEALISAQYSQKQEYAADDYGYDFLKRNGQDVKGMTSALRKIQALQEGAPDVVNALFSSHPDSGKRAERLENRDN